MAKYSKRYGDPFNNVFTWGLEVALGYLFKMGEDYMVKIQDKNDLYKKMNDLSGNKLSNHQVSNMIYYMKQHRYIEVEYSDNEQAVVLTNKAKIKIVEKIVGNKKNDKKYRFISFDIPERLHHKRDLFRRTIKRMGFRQIQQSLWATNKNIGEMVEAAIEEYEVGDYIAYIVSEKSNIDTHIKKILEVKLS